MSSPAIFVAYGVVFFIKVPAEHRHHSDFICHFFMLSNCPTLRAAKPLCCFSLDGAGAAKREAGAAVIFEHDPRTQNSLELHFY